MVVASRLTTLLPLAARNLVALSLRPYPGAKNWSWSVPDMMDIEEKSTVVVLTTGPNKTRNVGHSMFVVIGTLTVPQKNV